MIFKTKLNSRENVFILFPLLFVIFSSTSEGESNINVNLMEIENEYEVINKYDSFVPEVDVVCQCSCTDNTQERCSRERHCALLSNSTTTCTNHLTVDSDSSICSKYYKLCCKVYFTKSTWMKPYKTLQLKYHETFLTFQIASTSPGGISRAYNVTITNSVKNLLLNDDKVLHIPELDVLRDIPETWYFIENGINELKYSDAINAKDEQDMDKIGWFQYNDREKELAGVSRSILDKYFQIKLLDCHSNPPKYEWKLNAVCFISKGALYLPKNVQKVSDMFKDISSISIGEDKINIGATNGSNVNAFLSNVNSSPFIFTSSINETVLNLTFTKGSGTFDVEITSPHWIEIISFSASPPVKIITLFPKNYDSCQVCVSQNSQQLCQIPSLPKDDEKSVETITEGLKDISQIVGINNQTFQNESDVQFTTIPSFSENAYKTVLAIAITTLLLLFLGTLTVIYFCIRRKRKFTRRNSRDDEIRMEEGLLSDYRKANHSALNNAPQEHEKRFLNEVLSLNDIQKILMRITRKERRPLLEELDLSDEILEEIEKSSEFNKFNEAGIICKILEVWRKGKGNEATRNALKNALMKVNRHDIVNKEFSNLLENDEEMQEKYKEIQQKIEENQRDRNNNTEEYQEHLTSKNLQLNLQLLKDVDDDVESKRESMQLQKLFYPIDGKDSIKILVKGIEDLSKTLCLKLLKDWEKKEAYISKFKMVFSFKLKDFQQHDSIEELFIYEFKTIGVNGDDGINCIKAFEKETLLLLEGFDKLNEDCKRKFLSQIQKEKYPYMTIVVTSEGGLVELEKKDEILHGGILEIVNVKQLWDKIVIIKGKTCELTEAL